MNGLPTEAHDRYKPRLITSRAVSSLASSTPGTRIEVPALGAIEIQGDPVGVDVFMGANGEIGPFPTFRGDMFPGVSDGYLFLRQTSGTGTLRVYWWSPEVAPIRLAASAAAALSSGSMAVDTELPAAAALADDTANPTVPTAGAAALAWDPVGANWNRLRQPDALEEGNTVVNDADMNATGAKITITAAAGERVRIVGVSAMAKGGTSWGASAQLMGRMTVGGAAIDVMVHNGALSVNNKSSGIDLNGQTICLEAGDSFELNVTAAAGASTLGDLHVSYLKTRYPIS